MSDLVGQARQGDSSAYRALYEQHKGRVYALCLRMTGDSADAEDATQAAFVRAWERLGAFRGECSFATWLHRIAVNEVLGRRRSAHRRLSRESAGGDIEVAEGDTRPAAPGAELDLERAIALLPPGAREIFVLHDVEGYGHDEIASMTGLASGTSKAQLHRARRLLREVLNR